ncbi:MAG: ArgE/DapE family deacylase [Acidobacteria bacterium]|nr:ArgE/DapE family deacylase [Acidobacteriota bacterium]MCL5288682.1 ArgE/DapE family deacylase [Acidobacteriota bacterium]
MSIDNQLTVDLLKHLVAIDSVNPSLVPGARGEQAAAEFLRDWLRGQGIAAELQFAAPGRPNVVATMGLSQAAPHAKPALLIVAHLDTVGAGDMRDPFTPREENGRLYGRGALDIKSGVAAMCAAAAAIEQSGVALARPFVIAAVVDEECNSIGTETLLKHCAADAAIVLEPTDLKLVIAHKGYAWFEIVTHGRAAHGSLPAEGRDAVRMMGRVLDRLDERDRALQAKPSHPLLGTASLHASLISGGQELSSYPAECRLQIERRTLPGESMPTVESELRALLDNLHAHDAEFRATLRAMSSRPAYSIEPDAPIARAAATAILHVTAAAELAGMSAWTDTALLAEAGIPGVVFGPRGRGLHGAEEYVELDSVTSCAEVLHHLICTCCAA